MQGLLDRVTVVIPNYKTPKLIRRVVEGLLRYYPQVRLLLMDNGSEDESTEYLRGMASSGRNIRVILNKVNTGHGPAMHQGIEICETPLVCLIDSDCVILVEGGLELMMAPFSDPKVYATGEVVLIDVGGNTKEVGAPYVLPSRMMINRQKYWNLPPFNHHGAPAVLNIQGAVKAGYKLVNIPHLDAYFYHPGRGLRASGSHKLYGIPGWSHRTYYLPKDAPTAREMLKNARPEMLGKWR